MSEDRVRTSRILILLGILVLLSSFVLLLSLLWIQWEKKKEEKKEFFKRALIQAESSLNLVRYELFYTAPDDRWSGNWSMNGSRFIYTDLDGTRYENLLEEGKEDYRVTAFSNYRGEQVKAECRFKRTGL